MHMETNKDFLLEFTNKLKKIGNNPAGFYVALDSFKYTRPYDFDEEKKRFEELKTVTDKILSIVYDPAFHTENNEIILRSELSGKLSHESFSDTMRDPSLWKEKKGEMVPEYVHTVENIDTIDIYENRFIALLINEINDELDTILDDITPMVESIGEHYQNNLFTFGPYSPLRNMRQKEYPYSPFLLKGNEEKEELYALLSRIRKRMKHLKETEFYKITSKHPISHSVRPTNILIHDKLYSYCFKYYMANMRKEGKEEKRREILYYNYFFVSFLRSLKEREYLKKKNMPKLSFDNEDRLHFSPFEVKYSPFSFSFKEDETRMGLYIDVTLHYDEKDEKSSYYLATKEKYGEKNVSSFVSLKDEIHDAKVILITGNNLLKDYDSILTLSYRRNRNKALLGDLISSFSILIDANRDLYSEMCPVCGKNKTIFNGKEYLCQNCHSEYTMNKYSDKTLLWIKSYGKEQNV